MATIPERLKQLSEHVYYLAGAVNCVILKNGSEAVLIDTGQDKDYGKGIRKTCEHLGVTPVAIINTHSHADHYGGNDYLLSHYGVNNVVVYAPEFEKSILKTPYLEPVYLFGGAKPLVELMSKWLLAKPSKVDHTLIAGQLEIIGLNLDILDTSGHSHTHMSLICDDVLIAADALFGANILEKYPLPFGQDITKQIASCEALKKVDVNTVLPGHGEPSSNLSEMCEANLQAFQNAALNIQAACSGVSTEVVLRASCEALGITLNDLPRYYLNLCVVNAYLGYLREQGKVTLELIQNTLIWTSV